MIKATLLTMIAWLMVPALTASSAVTDAGEPEVTLLWAGDRTVLLHVGEQQFTVRGGNEVSLQLPAGEAVRVSVETPAETYHAGDFLIADEDSENRFTLFIENGELKLHYGEKDVAGQSETVATSSRPETTGRAGSQAISDERERIGDSMRHLGFGLNVSQEVSGGVLFLESNYRHMNFRDTAEFDNRSFDHGMVYSGRIGLNFIGGYWERGYGYEVEVPTYVFLPFDAGVGYGGSFGSLTPSVSLNATVALLTFILYELEDTGESEVNFDLFPSSSLYARFLTSWEPFSDSSFSVIGSLDVGFSGGSAFTFGIGYLF